MPRNSRARPGQVMIETVIAVLVITFVFLVLFRLSHMLTGKILMEHAAMRVARARSVGINDFMCEKTARASVIPVAGKRLWPEGNQLDYAQELASLAIYMSTPNEAVARGVFEYEGWQTLYVDAADGTDTKVSMETDWFKLSGQAGLENNFKLYMDNQGR